MLDEALDAAVAGFHVNGEAIEVPSRTLHLRHRQDDWTKRKFRRITGSCEHALQAVQRSCLWRVGMLSLIIAATAACIWGIAIFWYIRTKRQEAKLRENTIADKEAATVEWSEERLLAVMKRFPRSPGPVIAYAKCAQQRREWEEALRRYRLAMACNDARDFAGAAAALRELGRFDEADTLLRNAQRRFPGFSALPGRSTNGFDEANYLARYPDVANAVKQGLFKSGFHHYQVYGIHEKRETANVAEATPRPNGAGTVLSTRKASAFMKIRIIMMLKNEDDLALPWIKYHGSLVGYENLIVLDNGSTKERTLSALKWGAERGAKVDYQYSTQAEYVKRGSTYVDIIQRMDAKDPADFYIPLDCDEFLSVERDGRVNCSHRALAEELSSYVKCPNPLVIHAGLDNHPHKAGFFRWSPGQRKTFFAEGACAVLDHGFHVGRSRLGLDRIRTKIVYIHYHYKPYDLLVEHSKQKLEPFTTDFSEENMKKYLNDKKFCYHSAYYILKSREDYATAFNDTAFIEFPEIRRQFELLGERLPFA